MRAQTRRDPGSSLGSEEDRGVLRLPTPRRPHDRVIYFFLFLRGFRQIMLTASSSHDVVVGAETTAHG